MWGPTLTAPDSFGWAKGATFSFATIVTSGNTSNGVQTGNGAGASTYYAGLTLPTPCAALKFGAAFDYLNARDISANTWVGAVYSTYQFNDKLSLNMRAEYLNAGGNTSLGDSVNGGAMINLFGSNAQAQELTATVQYALWANVLTRLEFRWDHVNHFDNANNGIGYVTNAGNPYANAFMLAAQAIYTF